MLTLFPELELTTDPQPTASEAPKRTRRSRRRNTIHQLGLPYDLSASQIRTLWMGGRGRRDPHPKDIAQDCAVFRREEPFLNDGRSRDGYDQAVLFAETAIRHACQCLHTWSRMWACQVDRQLKDDGGRAYRKILREAWLAWEWIEEADRSPPLMTFAQACEVLSCRTEEVRDGIYRGGLERCSRREAARQAALVDVEWIGEPGDNVAEPAALSVWAMAWLGAVAGVEECSQ
jgi:hypothetical protein